MKKPLEKVQLHFVASIGKDIWTVPAELQLRLMQEVIRKDSSNKED